MASSKSSNSKSSAPAIANGKGKALAAPRTEAQAAPEQAPRLEQIAERAESAKAKKASAAKPAPRLKALDKMLGEAFAAPVSVKASPAREPKLALPKAKPAAGFNLPVPVVEVEAPKAKPAKRKPVIGRDARRAGAKVSKAAPKATPAKAKAEAPQGDKAQLIEQALRILRTTTKEGSVKQIRKPAAGKVKPLPGRKSPTTRDLVAAIAGVGAQMAFRAIQVAKADPKLAERVIAGKLSLAEAFEQVQ